MLILLSRAIPFLFYLLFFFVPLVLFPKTSELFEFNKVVLVYFFTTLITASWIIKSVNKRKILFRRTMLDIPLLVFLAFQVLSTLTSIDTRTSLLGYYSRFHGGLASSISYALLYWAYVSNMDKKRALKSIYILLTSAFLVSIYAILEHFGIDKDIWVQDVQNRVFSTLGQPNWLAAWIVALTPLTWGFALSAKRKTQNLKLHSVIASFWVWIILSALFFITLLYTKSRSGIIGFGVAYLVFWAGSFYLYKDNLKLMIRKYLLITFFLSFITLLVGSPWTPSLSKRIDSAKGRSKETEVVEAPKSQEPALAVGGSESGEIRKIVWRGAYDIWKNYPILGTGLETFAFSYYNFRPVEHNLVSEWDFLYNKAHNEYLNIAATTGTVGLISYLFLAGIILFSFYRNSQFSILNSQTKSNFTKNKLTTIALASGWISILVTNFFGFSVVPVALQFFLYPAIAITLVTSDKLQVTRIEKKSITSSQQLIIIVILLITSYFLLIAGRYWYADFLYAKGKLENDSNNFTLGREILTQVTKLSSKESIFWDELSQSSTGIALVLQDRGDVELAERFATSAIVESDKAVKLSYANVNLKRNRASMFIKLSSLNTSYLLNARETLVTATKQAPTDAKLFYNLGLAYVRTGELEKAIEVLEKTVEMKDNYRNARFALALVLIEAGDKEKAREELEYILEYVSPSDSLVEQELEELK